MKLKNYSCNIRFSWENREVRRRREKNDGIIWTVYDSINEKSIYTGKKLILITSHSFNSRFPLLVFDFIIELCVV